MPWILLCSLHCLLPRFPAAALPGVPTANADKTSASEPMRNRKERPTPPLADVLANDSARQELIDQLRKAAATPPPDSTPTLTPPAVKEPRCWKRHADQPGIRRAALVSLLSTVAQYHRLTA